MKIEEREVDVQETEEEFSREEWLQERFSLAYERVCEIRTEETVSLPYRAFFQKTAAFLRQAAEAPKKMRVEDTEEKKALNLALYQDILPENYHTSYGNPAYAQETLGELGVLLSFLYAEVRGAIVYAFEERLWDLTVVLELFLEVYACFEEEVPQEKEIRGILVSYVEDYCQEMVEYRVRGGIDPSMDFAARLIREADLSDSSYLYDFGEYVTENETRTAEYLNSLSQEEVDQMAAVFTEGYRKGFENARKNLKKKKTVQIRYQLGFERMMRSAMLQFEQMGLSPVISRYATHAVNKSDHQRTGYTGAIPNPQFDYDHRDDMALFLNSDFVKRKLRSTQEAYEKYKMLAAEHGGPAVLETFGEKPFEPRTCKEALRLTEEMQKQKTEMQNELGQIVNRYIKGDERSFTIISWPMPEIGEKYEEIFREVMKINTLDYRKYQEIQQTIIDTLDTCEWVEVKGQGDNETDLLIHLRTLTDPGHQTNFENCVADVNIPVGEVFTTPVLAGTGGLLHVQQVYLEGLLYRDLKLVFDCGQVIDYSCANFETEEENRRYIEENILHHHVKIPMGEFAIGTNTTAYVAARKYGIQDKLPILIAEKTGPHFAVGDTCYNWEEDNPVYNPDGKEIIARDNEISELRKEDLSLAYYNCHTDITIPYDELGSIRVIDDEGEMVSIIEEGRFVLPGTEALNEAFED